MNIPFLHPLLQKAASIQRMVRGSLSVIRKGPDGPYFNHQCREGGKTCTRYVPKDQAPAMREAIEAHHQFVECIDKYVDHISKATRAQIANDSKKKSTSPPTPTPPSPKTRKYDN